MYGNLAAMFFVRRRYRLSLRCRHAELSCCLLTTALNERRRRLLATLSHLGHALRATGHHAAAILCHRLCAASARSSADRVTEARELRNVGKGSELKHRSSLFDPIDAIRLRVGVESKL